MEHPKLRLKYGLDKETGKSRYIHEVKRGLLCNCICPICTQDLVAKTKGERRTPHFAHNNGAEECKGARMSMLHKLAQEVIKEESKVMLPAYKGRYIQHDAKLQAFDEVKLEEICKDEISRRRPDCIGKILSKGIEIWVEIYCTNPINKERREDIIRRQQYCIEIDFSDLLGTDYTKESIRERLLYKSDYRKWICHPEWDEEERRKAEEEIEKEKQKQEEAKLRWEERRLQLEALWRKQAEDKRREEEILRKQEEERRKKAEENREEISSLESTTDFYNKEAKIPVSQQGRDWIMYAKVIYSEKDALKTFYDVLKSDHTKVNLKYSHPLVQQELYLKVNELLPRTHLIVEVTKTYLQLLLAIWVSDKLNHNQEQKLCKIFAEDQDVRNSIFKAIKKIENINPREISENLIPDDTEKRDLVLQILRICYMK